MKNIIILDWRTEPVAGLFLKELKGEESLRGEYQILFSKRATVNAIVRTRPQLLIVGCSVDEKVFAGKLKEVNPKLKVVRFGSFVMEGQPQPPYDVLVTWADPSLSYKDSLIRLMKEFLTEIKKKETVLHHDFKRA